VIAGPGRRAISATRVAKMPDNIAIRIENADLWNARRLQLLLPTRLAQQALGRKGRGQIVVLVRQNGRLRDFVQGRLTLFWLIESGTLGRHHDYKRRSHGGFPTEPKIDRRKEARCKRERRIVHGSATANHVQAGTAHKLAQLRSGSKFRSPPCRVAQPPANAAMCGPQAPSPEFANQKLASGLQYARHFQQCSLGIVDEAKHGNGHHNRARRKQSIKGSRSSGIALSLATLRCCQRPNSRRSRRREPYFRKKAGASLSSPPACHPRRAWSGGCSW
jgi:hypothetical protein